MPIKYTVIFLRLKKILFSDKKLRYFINFAQNIDHGYTSEPPQLGGSNEYLRSMFSSKNKKKNVYPCKPQFYYIKIGGKGVYISRTCYHDGSLLSRLNIVVPRQEKPCFSIWVSITS